MKLLIDNALSPRVAGGLLAGGYQAVHVGQLSMANASDEAIFQWCLVNDYVIVSSDTDFGTLLAQRQAERPSVLLLRRISQRRPEAQIELLLANLPAIIEPLEVGSIVVVEENRIRVRPLPIHGAFYRPKTPK